MSLERQEGRIAQRSIEAWRDRRVQLGLASQTTSAKSRYKLYDRPQRSNFASALDNIKRERDPALPSTSSRAGQKRVVQISGDRNAKASPRMREAANQPRASFIRGDSSVDLGRRKSQYFKDVYSEYMKKRALTVGVAPRRIRIIKVLVPRSLDEALVESIKRYKPLKTFDNSWREPRLQWLDHIELESSAPPKTLPDDPEDSGFISDCFLCLYPFCRRRKGNK